MSRFSVGDVVRLKSGGPKMTVTEDADDNTVRCMWFDGSTPRSEVFPDDVLEYTEE